MTDRKGVVGFEAQPLTPDRFPHLVELFSRPGASIARGCYCTYYRDCGRTAGAPSSKSNQRALKALVDSGIVPGLIGYEQGRPIGWVSLGPRQDYARLARSPVMKPLDDKPVWSIVCFFVDSKARGRGITARLLRAAIDHARAHGATTLEAYPVDKEGRGHSDFLWFGAKTIFDRAGFREIARRRETRPVMRRTLRPRS